MALVGSPAYFRVQGTDGVLALRGILVEDQEDFLVIAVPGNAAVPGVDLEADFAAIDGGVSARFLRVPSVDVSPLQPQGFVPTVD